MLIIPLATFAGQTLVTSPGSQSLGLAIYQKSTGLYVDIANGGAPVLYGVLGRDRVKMVRDAYLGIDGDLMFVDQQGDLDPTYSGLGTRFLLFWLSAADVAAGIGA
jgi:hypothetical protein